MTQNNIVLLLYTILFLFSVVLSLRVSADVNLKSHLKFIANHHNIMADVAKNHVKKLPRVIAHRGACGQLPELTIEAFKQAIEDGADVIELDTSFTKDGQVVVIHEPELSVSTNALELKEQNLSPFSDPDKFRKWTVHSEDGYNYTKQDLWSWDFTLAELKQLRKKQVLAFRNQAFNGKYSIPTLKEVIQDVILKSDRKVVLLIEIKTCNFFTDRLREQGISKTKEDLIIETLKATGVLDRPDLIELQAFEENCLSNLKQRAPLLRAHQLLYMEKQLTEEAFQGWVNKGFFGIGVHKAMVTTGSAHDPGSDSYTEKYTITGSSGLVARAHDMGLQVTVWTIRNEDQYLPWNVNQDPSEEILYHVRAGVDGLITDFPKTALRSFRLLDLTAKSIFTNCED